MLFSTPIALALLAAIAPATAVPKSPAEKVDSALLQKRDSATVTLYHDNNCQSEYYQDQINGDSCSSPSEGFSSMIINSCSDLADSITVYSGNACAGSSGTEYNCEQWQNTCAGFDVVNSAYYFVNV